MTPEFNAEFLSLVQSVRRIGDLIGYPKDKSTVLDEIERELIKDGMEAKVKDIEYSQPDENAEHRMGAQLMGVR